MLKIDFLAWETDAWLEGIRDFLGLLEGAIQEVSQRERATLERVAKEAQMDADEYFSEVRVLDYKFGMWLPNASAYSAVVLLHSLVETQLYEYADRVRRAKELHVGVRDLKGQGIDAAKTYLTKVAAIDFGADLGWEELRNLQKIRNIIVHRRGRQGASPEHQAVVRALLKTYSQDLSLAEEINPADPSGPPGNLHALREPG